MVRQIIRGTGKTLIAFGVLLFLFVAYQLWGTGIAERRDQRNLRSQLQDLFEPVPAAEASPSLPTPTTVTADPIPGEAVALIRIPRIDVEKAVVEGVSVEDLKKGPGHYADTPLPGEPGNAAIAGHRTTYGAPFYSLDSLEPGDPIEVQTRAGKFVYAVVSTTIVSPDEVSVLDPPTQAPMNRLTLTTCHPRFSAAKRMIVVAELKGEAVEPPPPPADAPPPSATPVRRSIEGGLSGVRVSKEPVIAWGVLAATIWLGAWLLGRQWKPWPVYLLATPIFLVVLFMFYEQVARLLPANV